MNEYLSPQLSRYVERARTVANEVAGPLAEEIDRDARWPAESMAALARDGLAGLTVPAHLGGLGQGLSGLAAATEVLGRTCASTAMCFGMHCVGSAVIAAKATASQEEEFLRPIARGEHLTSLALSETGSGSLLFLPRASMTRVDEGFVLEGEKQFVTNGGHADSYVVSTCALEGEGDFSCVVVDRDAPGVTWGEPWKGFGMRGNSSRAMRLEQVRLPSARLLGEEGDQAWYVFEVVAPYFLTAMAGTYLGVAQGALELALQHLRERRFAHSGQSLADVEVLQHRVGQLWMEVEKTRLLLYHAARMGDLGSMDALAAVLSSKVAAATTAVDVANEAMTLCGGIGYRENSALTRMLRDARAGHVMSPTTDMLTLWTGRSVLGMALI